ncbi:phosphopantothenoylcysteine decarboxylase [Planctomycetota bacterium]
MHVLITAGGTREYIDPVRFISNASTGKMGYALARAALNGGHPVTLITAPTHIRLPASAQTIQVVSASDMFHAVQNSFAKCDVLIMCAAVSDYTVINPASSKLKKTTRTLTLKLEPTVDILQWAGAEKLRTPRKPKLLVGFGLEDQDLKERAEAKLRQKHLDMIVANGPEAIGAEKSVVHIKSTDAPWQTFPLAGKLTQARRILRLIEHELTQR